MPRRSQHWDRPSGREGDVTRRETGDGRGAVATSHRRHGGPTRHAIATPWKPPVGAKRAPASAAVVACEDGGDTSLARGALRTGGLAPPSSPNLVAEDHPPTHPPQPTSGPGGPGGPGGAGWGLGAGLACVRRRRLATGRLRADCAVGSGEWAEPPHSPWTLRRSPKKRPFFALFSGPDPVFRTLRKKPTLVSKTP